MRNIFIRCIRFSLQQLLQNDCERDVCRFAINDERDPKESNEGCQDAAEAAASARVRRVRTRSVSDGISRRPGSIIFRPLPAPLTLSFAVLKSGPWPAQCFDAIIYQPRSRQLHSIP